jgi:hypothetical protein
MITTLSLLRQFGFGIAAAADGCSKMKIIAADRAAELAEEIFPFYCSLFPAVRAILAGLI